MVEMDYEEMNLGLNPNYAPDYKSPLPPSSDEKKRRDYRYHRKMNRFELMELEGSIYEFCQ